nr:trinucleotide repeat-containing gene 6C protein isoform X1 [Ciona intestinalis]XP_018667012.1 trinucleotide repeat-containing gene 6C protein isoform X2 [Ciona intestinalis]|eukprot:XP_018667011.1 trinucleotide repeat-containing gene 6C protein isoform X1 [Ciona intestinalis]
MSSNVPWTNQFEPVSLSQSSLTSSQSTWSRTAAAVNTPQTNPANWPQLGSAEQDTTSVMSQTQLQSAPSQEDTGWATTSSNPSAANDADQSGTSGWGRIPDNGTKPPNTNVSTGWGVPTGIPWGQHSSNIDDGTAVWGKSTAAQQPQQGNWGNPVNKNTSEPSAPAPSGWGTPDPSSSVTQSHIQNQDINQQLQSNSQPQMTNANQPPTTSHPVSWAKAASAGLPAATNASETNSAEEAENSEASAGQNTAVTSEPDPVQQLVNSHEGWGTKPIQQGTSWNISDRNMNPVNNNSRTYPPVNNGTEAWGKPSGGQMPQNSGWGEAPSNKTSSSGWGGNYGNLPSQPSGASAQNWGVPSQPRPAFMPNHPNGNSGWGDQQRSGSGVNAGRWNDMPGQTPQNNWNAPPVPQHPQGGGAGWGNMQQPSDNQSNPGWGSMPPGRPLQPNNNWGNGRVQQSPHSPAADQSQWGRQDGGINPMTRRLSNVDDGTSAWGDPTTYGKVNMWDKHGKIGGAQDSNGGQMNNPSGGSGDAKGWGMPPNQNINQPPSPKSWGNTSPTRMAGDNGTPGWGFKAPRPDKVATGWDKPTAGSGWNTASKPSGWGQPNEPQWGQSENNSGWGQPMGKIDNLMKNMDYGPRGNLPPQPNINPQLRSPMPPALPPQLQNQFQQIRNAVMNGVIPQQFLNPQVMTPQHMHTLLQLVNKASEYQRLQLQLNMITQNKNIAPIVRQQQIVECTKIMRQYQQQIDAQRTAIFQNMLQKTQPSKSNGPLGGMDLSGHRPTANQSMISPLNSMTALGQALPPNVPMSNIPSPSVREQKSRFMNHWKRPTSLGMGDYQQTGNVPNNLGFFPGPSGDFNGMRYESPQDEMASMEKQYYSTDAANKAEDLATPNYTEAPSEPNSTLADIGPPEFTPGVPWKGFRRIDPEADPDITPGSVAIAKTMSINTVRDADQVLKRERSAHSESSTGLQNNEETSLANQPPTTANTDANVSSMWSTGANGASSTTTVSQSLSAPQDPWKVSSNQSLSRPPPPGIGGSAFRPTKELAPTWENVPNNSWDQNMTRTSQGGNNWASQQQQQQPQQPQQQQQQESLGSWLVLTNFNQQVDVAGVRQLCMQHGNMVSFQGHYPIEGMALVRYASPEDAANAKKALNMFMAGSTMLVATVATDHEVANFVNATAGGSWGSTAGTPGSRFVSNSGSTGGFISQPPQNPSLAISSDAASVSSQQQQQQQLWGNSNPQGGNWPSNMPPSMPWSGTSSEDMSRIMSPLHTLLPENLLGGETM